MAFAASPSRSTLAEINITPLVDVMLVLLVIFMVTAPMLELKLPLQLSHPTPPRPERSEPLRLEVTPAGFFRVDGKEMTARDLPAALARLHADNPGTTLELSVDPDADYQSAATALASARNAGFDVGMR